MATSNWSTSVLSGLSSDTEPTIVVTFESAKYIFNAGENTSRSWLQSRNNWKKAKGLFFTSVGTQRMSGVPGLLMFLADGGIRNVNVVGPQGVLHSLAAMRLYTYRENMGVDCIEVGSSAGDVAPSPTYVDQNITLYSIPIHPEDSPSQSSTLKRKREMSPASSSKALSISNHEGSKTFDAATEETSTEVPLFDRMHLPDFSPTNLRDEDAQEWRRLTIKHMFPWKEPPFIPMKPSSGKLKRVNGKETQVPEVPPSASLSTAQQTALHLPFVSRKSPQSFNPSGCDKQLPRFRYKKAGKHLPATQRPTLAYILVGPKVRGKFDVQRAQALGLEGRLRGRVAKGETVTYLIDDGKGGQVERTVKPEDCIGPSEIPGTLIVLDIPSREYIPAVISSFTSSRFYSKFRSRLDDDRREFAVNAVFHLCGDGVLEDDRYRDFIQGFSAETHHIISSHEYSPDPVTFTQAAYSQLRLNKLDSDMFRLPKFALTSKKELEDIPELSSKASVLLSNTLVQMRPLRPPRLDPSVQTDPFHDAASTSTPLTLPSVTLDKFGYAQRLVKITNDRGTPSLQGDDVRIIPLGTGSALPSKYRNVSGILIMIPRWGNILLEAGEGSWGQLARYFGTSLDSDTNVWNVLRAIKCIFVSHAHGDHHIGLAKILAMRKKLEPPPFEPLYLVTINSVHLGLREMSDIEDLGLDLNLENNGVIPIQSTALHYRANLEDQSRTMTLIKNLCSTLGLRRMSTVDVWHRTQCFGVVIDHQDGWSIVFSGDTQPTDKLVEAGQNATLLIHEATMADDQAEMARSKAHSTVGQAIDIGKRMNAENILLTHFSARYPKMPPSILDASQQRSSENCKNDPKIGVAFDLANIRLGDFWKLDSYLPAIEQSFADTAEEGEDEQVGVDIDW